MSLRRKSLLTSCMVAGALVLASGQVLAAPPKPQLTTPGISCLSSTPSSITLQVCGTGTYGAPAGFSIHMKTRTDYDANGWAATGSYTCLSLGGNCNGGNNPWSLSTGECVNVTISASTVADYAGQGVCGVSSDCGLYPLTCNTEYVFRVFAHGNSDYTLSDMGPTPPLSCFTSPCPNPGECTLTWGYWKTHGPAGCNPSGNQPNDWNVSSLTIGNLTLDEAALCAILQDNPNACGKGGGSNSGANTVLILEHQLIAAMLNVAEGAIHCPFADQAIVAANAALAGHEYDCIGAGTATGQQLIGIKDLLAAYNDDQCNCPVPSKPQAGIMGAGSSEPGVTKSSKSTSWGQLKTIYR